MTSVANRIFNTKLKNAITLLKTPVSDVSHNADLNEGLNLIRDLLRQGQNPETNAKIAAAVYEANDVEGIEIIDKWRDTIPFLRGKTLENNIETLRFVCHSPIFDSHQRQVTAVCLYNRGYIEVCYDCFVHIATDTCVDVSYRVDATRYLIVSGDDDYSQTAQDILMEIVDDQQYESGIRYNIIAGFISKTGVNSIMNRDKLLIPYDEEFVYCLQSIFFSNEKNDVRDRILSGQHIIQMECIENDDKMNVMERLFSIVENKENSENTRADAADVLIRLATPEFVRKTRSLLIDIGHSGAADGENMSARANIIYNDSQNIHEFGEQVDKFIEKMINETDIHIKPYAAVYEEVGAKIGEVCKTSTDKFEARKALNRINIDTARFTKYRVTLAEIFVHIWTRIQSYPDEQRVNLEQRMIDELIDMEDTCSSGHSGRLVNVLALYDNALQISWDSQIHANMVARMNVLLREAPNSEDLSIAQTEFAEDEEKDVYNKFIEEHTSVIFDELFEEFVGGNYVNEKSFEEMFNEGIILWKLEK